MSPKLVIKMAFDPRMNVAEGNEEISVGLCGFKGIVCNKN